MYWFRSLERLYIEACATGRLCLPVHTDGLCFPRLFLANHNGKQGATAGGAAAVHEGGRFVLCYSLVVQLAKSNVTCRGMAQTL